KLMALHLLYCNLTGDFAAAENYNEREVDNKIKLALQLEHNPDAPTCYETFWKVVQDFLTSTANLLLVIDDHRHSLVIYLARAIFVNKFVQQVTALCPSKMPIL
ncbi:8213_t:CDS:2, partial [Cetraspora pellucida]